MIEERRRPARGTGVTVAIILAAGIAALLVAFPCAASDRNDDELQDDEPRCNRHDDLSCTIVRETAAGIWVWTERFRPTEPNGPTWSIAVGRGVAGSAPTVQFLPSPPAPGRATPNGAPILE